MPTTLARNTTKMKYFKSIPMTALGRYVEFYIRGQLGSYALIANSHLSFSNRTIVVPKVCVPNPSTPCGRFLNVTINRATCKPIEIRMDA